MAHNNEAPDAPSQEANGTRDQRIWIIGGNALIIGLSWTGLLDRLALDYIDSASISALLAFSTARTLNAIVSILQSIQTGPVIATIHPGELLDPINDLAEQFSDVMKLAIASLFGQKMVIEIASTTLFKILLTLSGALLCISIFFRQSLTSSALFRVFSFFAFIRIIIVLVVLMNGMIAHAFVDQYADREASVIDASADEVGSAVPGLAPAQPSDISAEEQASLNGRLAFLKTEEERVSQKVQAAKSQVSESQEALETARRDFREYRADIGMVEKLNVFDRTSQYKTLSEELENRKAALDASVARLEAATSSMASIHDETAEINGRLSGESSGWFASMQSGLNKLKAATDFSALKEKLDRITTSLLNMMAVFILKTIIMPLIILVLFLKGFKRIWGVDIRDWIHDESARLREKRQ
ncbi:hypothetical protein C7446_0522 [Kushneria sinocarnis]|uniref:Uncharacterized protein n=1 Tax=Kushneria sinocarnis TaxID=595502 RepID=A0A420WYX9_9GAMM|nr:hypothetical protein [Kushneria sinocarnis]RKR06543.1 hypothetical protein C7446_0522 [Kushneria sinocarnis]